MEMISVIIPLYNKDMSIRQTLLSVLKQNYSDFEVVIVDDGSTDNSASIVNTIAESDNRVNYYYKKNGGVSSARNYGVKKAKGEWVVFLDADDEMKPNNLCTLMHLLCKYNVNLAAANVTVMDANGVCRENQLHLEKETCFSNYIKAIIKQQAIWGNGASIYKKSLLMEKPYNENLSRYEDAEFELNILLNEKVAISPNVICIIHSEFAQLSKVSNNNKCKDFIFNMDFSDKSFWQKVKMGQFINEGCFTYSNGKASLKEMYGYFYYWRYVYVFFRKFFSVRYRIKKLLLFK